MISPVLLIALPLLFSFIPTIFKKWEKESLSLIAVLNLLILLFIQKGIYHIGGWQPPFGISLVLDQYAYVAVLVINILFALSVFLSYKTVGKYAIVLLIALAALNGMVLTGDLFNLFVFIEISAVAAYILSSMTKKYKHTFNYLVIGTLGSGLYLLGTVMLYNMFGSLNMVDIHEKILALNVSSKALVLPLTLIFIGLGVEAKLLPLNGWVKGVLGNANDLVGALLSSTYAATIMFVFGRLFLGVFVLSGGLKTIFIAVTVLTFVLAEFAAFSKKSLREILLFSSIAQSGLVITLFLSGLVFPAVLQLINNVVAKLVMFTIAGGLAIEAGSDDVEDLRGIFKTHPMIGFGFSVAALSLIGLPVFFGFYTKINVLLSLFSLNNLWLPAIILIVAIIEGAYFIRLLAKLWNPGEEGIESSGEAVTERYLKHAKKLGWVVSLIGVLFIASGVLSFRIGDKVQEAINISELDAPAYSMDWLGGMKK